MMRLANAQGRHVSLVLRLCDLVTGEVIVGGVDISVMSADGMQASIAKPDGYFVFTGSRPQGVHIRSKAYCDAVIATDDHTRGVLRYALVPGITGGGTFSVPNDAWVGFNGRGYSLAGALSETSTEVLLQKEDFRDLTDLYHALVAPGGATEAVYLEKNLGGGRYALRAPPAKVYQARRTRLVELHRTSGGAIPIPPGMDTAFILAGGAIFTKSLEGY